MTIYVLFLCQIRHVVPLKVHPERITKVHKKWLLILIMKELNFLFPISIIAELKDKIIFALIYSVMKIIRFILFMSQIKNMEIIWIYCWYERKINRTMCVSKILADSFIIKQKIKIKKYFCKCCLQCFGSEKILINHKENGLIKNVKQHKMKKCFN